MVFQENLDDALAHKKAEGEKDMGGSSGAHMRTISLVYTQTHSELSAHENTNPSSIESSRFWLFKIMKKKNYTRHSSAASKLLPL